MKTAKNGYFCCFLGFCLMFDAFHSLIGLACARINFFGHSHSIKDDIFQFSYSYEQMLETSKLTPSEISVCLKSTNQKKFWAIRFTIFSSGFNYGTSTMIRSWREKKYTPPFASPPDVFRIYLWHDNNFQLFYKI